MTMKVNCEIEPADLTDDEGRLRYGVTATCPICGYVTESYGTEDASVKRCLVLLREGCPRKEKNFYEGTL